MTRTVEILLASYNGARFLPDQLASLSAQTHRDWRLTWRDDGSTDDCAAILDRFGGLRLPGDARLGVTAGFAALLAARDRDAAAYAFCDQDDVWLPGKLESGLALLADGPAMVCGRLTLVDAALRPLGLSPAPRRPACFGDALVENRATGCTVLLNQAAAALMDAPWPPGVVMHDWWAMLCVLAAGGAVAYQAEPQILYRQHGGNVVGIQAGVVSLKMLMAS